MNYLFNLMVELLRIFNFSNNLVIAFNNLNILDTYSFLFLKLLNLFLNLKYNYLQKKFILKFINLIKYVY